jgi:hypothetical protein
LALAGELLPQAVKGVAFAAHGLANGLEAIVSNTYGHEDGRETTLLEAVMLIALLVAFATRVATKMQVRGGESWPARVLFCPSGIVYAVPAPAAAPATRTPPRGFGT